ncbi:MAG: anti-sigma factor domain-containing protein, partial [Flavobacteriales bacterium]
LSTVSGKSELTADQLKNIKTDYIQLANQVSIMSHCDMKVKMEAGSECKQSCCLMIYCDGKKQEMYVQVNKLKPAPEGDLYQLWAVVDDKPVDMGRVEIPNDSLALKPVKFVHHAQAFVLTLEENGYDTVIHEDEIHAQVSMDHQGM